MTTNCQGQRQIVIELRSQRRIASGSGVNSSKFCIWSDLLADWSCRQSFVPG